ncbi:MAG: O-antigen ligase family protein [Deltaproteobacteria bacterium]|nr:MAG: O-antigen ligase family protein [Deltaproteobacteria bacterium]
MFTDSKPLKFIFLFWWIALQWVYSSQFPSPEEDMKGLLFYGGACVFFLIFFQKKKPVISSLTVLLMAYLLMACLSLNSGIAWYDGWIEIGRLILWMVAAVLFVQISEAYIERLLNVSIISSSLIALGTLLEASGIATWKHLPIVLTNMTPIGHVSYYGLFMAGSFLIALSVYFNSQNYHRQILGALASALTFAALWHTGTRSNLVGLLMGLLVAGGLILKFKKFSKTHFIKLFLILGLVFLSVQLSPTPYRGVRTTARFQAMTQVLEKQDAVTLDGASSQRWRLGKKSWEMIREKPFLGWGVDSYRFVYPEFAHGMDYTINSWIMHPHNEIFHQWATVGLFGLILFVFFWSYLCFNSYQKLKKLNSATQDFSKIILGLSGVVLMLGSWQFDTNYQQPLSRAFMALLRGFF